MEVLGTKMGRKDSKELRDALRRCALFAGISSEGLDRVATVGTFVLHQPGEEIVSHKDETDDVLVLLSGIARIVIYSSGGRAVTYGRLHPGELFGEFAAIDGGPRSASVEAVQGSRVLRLAAVVFWELMASEPAFSRAIVTHLVGTARKLTERVFEFSTLAVNNRIHAELLRLVRESVGQGGEAVVAPMPTHSEIAERISTHREAVARELSHLSEIGVVARRGNRLTVTDLPRLEKMVHEATGE